MEIYLDNAATTAVYPEVAKLVSDIMCGDYGNPSSMHKKGIDAERYVVNAAKEIARILKADEKNIYFTSGGTESNNWAITGTAYASQRRGKHIITTQIEHAAVTGPLEFLESRGYEITRIPVDKYGFADPEAVINALRDDTILVSVMAVNNEIGSIQPVEEIGSLLKKSGSAALFHVDAIQAFGKYHIYPKRWNIDLLSASGHKIHGPKGTGFLYISPRAKIKPLIYGGGQQNGMRSGTDNVPGDAGFALAARIMDEHFDENAAQMTAVQKRMLEGLERIADVKVHGMPAPKGAYHIVNASFLGIRSEVLLHSLEEKGIYISSGSACSSHKRAPSATLTAIGCSKEEIESSIRFSFCETTTEEEIDITLEALDGIVPALRKYTRH